MTPRPGHHGYTLPELVTLIGVLAVMAAVAVPSAAGLQRRLLAAQGAARLALVLRTAQARAQSTGAAVQVVVDGDGRYRVSEPGDAASVESSGCLGVAVAGNYPDGSVSFSPPGRPCLPGTSVPRAGSFTVGGAGGDVVVLQLGGCIRCR